MGAMARLFYDARAHRLGVALRGYLLLFERREPPAYSQIAGLRLLVIFVVLELIVGPRTPALDWLGLSPPAWLRVPALLATSVLAVRLLAKVELADIGFLAWRQWTATEKLYFVQVVLLANALFIVTYGGQLEGLRERHDVWPAALAIAAIEFLWGFYQEVNYRGILQTALTRRFGSIRGPLAANVVFTFGPLHFYHFTAARPWSSTALMLSVVFCIGLFFSFIFQRTRNIWLVGTFHGIGNAYMNGATRIADLLAY